jgi:chlorite dismutase
MNVMTQPLLVAFVGGEHGDWRIASIQAVTGNGLKAASRLAVVEGAGVSAPTGVWHHSGVTSNERYVERDERAALVGRQPSLGRSSATCAALIPIRKSAKWWELTQGERREIFEQRSRHIATGLAYLPAIARRLHHSRDLGGEFDFLTWFEFAPSDAGAFDEVVGRLRATEEWSFIEREVDIRLDR